MTGPGRHGAVAAGHQVTANAAAEILRDGGNAFDAAVAALLAACVAEPVLASPGGGGFLLAHAEGKTHAFDFFVDAPRVKQPLNDIEFEEIEVDFGTAGNPFMSARALRQRLATCQDCLPFTRHWENCR